MPNPPRGRRARRGPRAGNRARPLSPSETLSNPDIAADIAEGFARGMAEAAAAFDSLGSAFANCVQPRPMLPHTGDTMTVRPEPGTMWTPTYDVERTLRSTLHGRPSRDQWTYTIYPGGSYVAGFDVVVDGEHSQHGVLIVEAEGEFPLVSGDVQLALSGDVDAVELGESAARRWAVGAGLVLRVTMPRPPTDDPGVAARRAENDHRRARIIEERRQRAAKIEGATARAKETFLGFLTPDQKKQFPMGYITCLGSDGNTYRIDVDSTPVDNVHWLADPAEPDDFTGTFCAAPGSIGQPYHDMFLGQLMALTANAPGFLEVANYSGGDWPPSRPRRRPHEGRLVTFNFTIDSAEALIAFRRAF